MCAAIAAFPAPTPHRAVTVRTVGVDRSGRWLSHAWRDFTRAPGPSLAYGGAFVVVSFTLTVGLWLAGMASLVLPFAGGFLLMAPILAVGLYEISRRLEAGEVLKAKEIFASCSRNGGQLAAMGVVLMLMMFIWILLALVLFALFFHQQPPTLDRFVEEIAFSPRGAVFLALGTAVGGALATLIFVITAFSIPMLLDRQVDVVTAILASVAAVRANLPVMFGWAAMIALLAGFGLVTGFLGLAVAFPLLGYATWHAYRDVIGDHSV